MAKTLREQLGDAFNASDLSLPELKEKSGLDIDTTSLGRKLRSKQLMSTTECEVLARILGVRVEFGRNRRAA